MAAGHEVLRTAVLGLLHERPMHGYELRKQLTLMLGWGRAFSYGSLYPSLRAMAERGWIAQESPSETAAETALRPPRGSATPRRPPVRRSRIVYRITDAGRARFLELLDETEPAAGDDEAFGVRFAFFARTNPTVRLRLLQARRRRLEDRLDRVRDQLQRTQEALDTYAVELQRHGLESTERDIRWLDRLIAREQQEQDQGV